jgi:hypothetical protein
MCDAVLKKWKLAGPKSLNDGAWGVDGKPLAKPGAYNSGLWLFRDRTTITHFFPPNFLPPYDTKEKREIILSFLTEEWDEKTLEWKKAEYANQEVSKASAAKFFEMCGNPIETLLRGGVTK